MEQQEKTREQMKPVIFLDRDGTINEEVNYLHRPEDLKLLQGVTEAIRQFNQAGFRVVIVTNQAGVARGYYSEADVVKLHEYLNELLEKSGAHIDNFYYCPHHPEHGIGAYKTVCRCRKPDIGMFLQAETEGTVDREHSYMIGDKWLDTQAGSRFGVQTVLVGTGYGQKLYEEAREAGTAGDREHPMDYFAKTLQDAADWILNREQEAGSKNAGVENET